MKFARKYLTLPSIFILMISCSTGDLPSISIQPSQDVYEQAAVERISSMDILWVIDNSGSMKSYQDQIRENFISFMEDFTSKNFNDFQIGVTTTDGFRDFEFGSPNFGTWNDINGSFSTNDLPCKDGQVSGCYDYDTDVDGRFRSGQTRSDLKSTNCDVCYSDPEDELTIGGGRIVNILTNDVLAELREVCEIVNNDADLTNDCEDVDDPGVTVSGDDKFLDLFDQIMDNTGTSGTGDERAFQSLQAARLNPRNKDLFRDSTHLAVILVSDEDDTSVNQSGRCNGYRQNDDYGALFCPNAYPTSFYKDLLEIATNETLGVTIHNMGINPKGVGYQASYFNDTDFLDVFDGVNDGDVTTTVTASEARAAYIAGMKNSYDDNVVSPPGDFLYRTNGAAPYSNWTSNDPDRKECRNIQLVDANNGFPRYFSRRHTELAESSNGVVASLCADFAESLENIAQTIIERTSEFFLGDNVPSQSVLDQGLVFVAIRNVGEELFTTIERDKTQTNGWDYNSANNSIVFFGSAIPENEAEISVIFDRETLN